MKGPLTGAAAARFWGKVNLDGPVPERRPDLGPCWIWSASTQQRRGGYGQFAAAHGVVVRAHIAAYEMKVGPVPDGLQLDHLCCVTACVRPSHLEPVTPLVNFLRSNHPSAVAWRSGQCKAGHERSSENTLIKPDGARRCRPCRRAQQRARRDRLKLVAA